MNPADAIVVLVTGAMLGPVVWRITRFLLLDDTQTYKNFENARRLEADPAYRLVQASRRTRNGFAVFERVG